MFCFWNIQGDKLEPMFSNNNYHPKSVVIENSAFGLLGRGNWLSSTEALPETLAWSSSPWEVFSTALLGKNKTQDAAGPKSERVFLDDPVLSAQSIECRSATELSGHSDASWDLVVTDPPFGGLLHYSELSDFFHVWLRLALRRRYPTEFGPEYTPKTLEVVANRARQPEDPDGFYRRLLTECWRESHRILKPGGLLAFTFHHSEDEPWVDVLQSLFDAGFYLEATYPIRSDETKGEGEFGSKKVEYDIIHVCRKRTEDPKAVSWGRMRREVLNDVRQMRSVLEHHARAGLPSADLQVIKRGKALEYYSRHYGKVLLDEGRELPVRDAVLGIIQLLEDEGARAQDLPPAESEPFTRQFLRLFSQHASLPRDQLQKFLRGTGIAPDDFVARGWCQVEHKEYVLVPPQELAAAWHGKHRQNLASDYDQAAFLIGACFDGSGINATDTLNNPNFHPHPALGALLEWHVKRGATLEIRNAAIRARALLNAWQRAHPEQEAQLRMSFA